MNKITFIGSTSSNYLFGKGRGKDKKKRKQRLITSAVALGGSTLAGVGLGSMVFNGKKPLLNIRKRTLLTNARDFIFRPKPKKGSLIATKILPIAGGILGNAQRVRYEGISGLDNAANRFLPLSSALTGLSIGVDIDKKIDKDKLRYKKEGTRSRLGKIVNDARIGASSTAGVLAVEETVNKTLRSLSKSGNLPLRTKILGTVGAGVGGAIYGGVKGALLGGTIGSGIGTIRGFRQKNKTKDKK